MTQPSTGTVVAESRWSLAFIWSQTTTGVGLPTLPTFRLEPTRCCGHAKRRWVEAMTMTQTSYEQSSPSSASSSGTGTSTNTFGAAASSLVTDGTGGRRADQPRVLGQHAALVLGWRR